MGKNVQLLDENLRDAPLRDGLLFRDVRTTAARVYGLVEGTYERIPEALRANATEKLLTFAGHTSGGRVRFVTASKRLGLRMKVTDGQGLPHMAFSGCAGIDCYLGAGPAPQYAGTRWPPLGERLLESELALPGEPVTVTLYLPLYDGVELLELGVEPEAALLPPEPYAREVPLVFYGSSITQGGCACRSSNSYAALVSRWLDSDFRCLGFSGSAKGEQWMASYIASLPMSCFVYDYDHNAPSAEALRQTHRAFLETILARQPDIPVVALSRPNPDLSGPDGERREVVRETCAWAAAQGADIQFVDGAELLGEAGRECCTVDGIHPNDLGFWRMARAVYPYVRAALERHGEGSTILGEEGTRR